MANFMILAGLALLASVAAQDHVSDSIVAADGDNIFQRSFLRTTLGPATGDEVLMTEFQEDLEDLQKSYLEMDCVSKLGDFPTRADDQIATPNQGRQRGCTCGFLYSQGKGRIKLIDELSVRMRVGNIKSSVSSGTAIGGPNTMSKLDAFAVTRATQTAEQCIDGMAGDFPCKNVDLVHHWALPPPFSTSQDVWGWTHTSSQREFVVMGVNKGHMFFEITDGSLIVLGLLRGTNNGTSKWHDVKVMKNWAYMGSENNSEGMQVFNMLKLLDLKNKECDSPTENADAQYICRILEYDALYKGTSEFPVGASHNLATHPESDTVFILGATARRGPGPCKGGLHAVNVTDPLNPTFAGCFSDGGYVHDADCVTYNGPNSYFQGTVMCACFNEDKVAIVNATDTRNMNMIYEVTPRKGNSYTHQGFWSTSQQYIVFGDEDDEYSEITTNGKTATYILDATYPNLIRRSVREYEGRTKAIDHNQYAVRYPGTDYDVIYQANYESGLEVLKVNSYKEADFENIGYFDTYLAEIQVEFEGAWSVYPYFDSGLVVVSTFREGMFLLRPNLEAMGIPPLTTNPPAPTENPTIGVTCVDDPDFQRDTKPGLDKGCAWAGERSKKFRCGMKQKNGRSVATYCPQTCGFDCSKTEPPIESPTGSPTFSADRCEDDEDFVRSAKPGVGKTCSWVVTGSASRTAFRCDRPELNGKKVKHFCPKSCNVPCTGGTPDTDDELECSLRESSRRTITVNGNQRNCKWLSERPPILRKKYCGDFNITRKGKKCPVTCGGQGRGPCSFLANQS